MGFGFGDEGGEGEGLVIEALFLGGPRVSVAIVAGGEECGVEEAGELGRGDIAVAGDERGDFAGVRVGLGWKVTSDGRSKDSTVPLGRSMRTCREMASGRAVGDRLCAPARVMVKRDRVIPAVVMRAVIWRMRGMLPYQRKPSNGGRGSSRRSAMPARTAARWKVWASCGSSSAVMSRGEAPVGW